MAHARAFGAAFVDGTLQQAHVAGLDDEAAITVIATVRGPGRWTAEVYPLFAFGRRWAIFPPAPQPPALNGPGRFIHLWS